MNTTATATETAAAVEAATVHTWTVSPSEAAATAERVAKINKRLTKRGYTGLVELTVGEPYTVTETEDGGADAMREILADGDRPDAVFVASDLMARGAISVLDAAGLRVPEDVAVVGFDDSPVATSAAPQLTTMRQPSFEQGQTMAGLLLDILAGQNPPHGTILSAELVVRASA